MSPNYIRFPDKRSSWHVIGKVDEVGWWTVCGLSVREEAPVSDQLPMGEKSCENCLRFETHQLDEIENEKEDTS